MTDLILLSYPQGGGGGTEWSDKDSYGGLPITSIAVTWGNDGTSHVYVKSIQVQYGGKWGPVHGSEDATNKGTFDVPDGQHITKVSGTSAKYINSLKFSTESQESDTYGDSAGGTPFSWHDVLTLYFQGRAGTVLNRLQNAYPVAVSGQITASDLQGGAGKTAQWSDQDFVKNTDRDVIRSIKLYTGDYNNSTVILGLQVQYGDAWGPVHGKTTSDESQYTLNKDEYIQAITGRSGDRIDQLTFINNKNDSQDYGGKGGDTFSWSGGRALYFVGTTLDDSTNFENGQLVDLGSLWIA